MLSVVEKLLERINIRDDGCWMFLGSWDSGQYGIITHGRGYRRRAHVISYEYHTGPIPQGMCVLHECDHPWCVNPKHLFLGSKQDNVTDMWNKDRGARHKGELSGTAILKESDVLEIYSLLKQGVAQISIGIMFGVSRSAIRDIKLGKHWAHLYEAFIQ